MNMMVSAEDVEDVVREIVKETSVVTGLLVEVGTGDEVAWLEEYGEWRLMNFSFPKFYNAYRTVSGLVKFIWGVDIWLGGWFPLVKAVRVLNLLVTAGVVLALR